MLELWLTQGSLSQAPRELRENDSREICGFLKHCNPEEHTIFHSEQNRNMLGSAGGHHRFLLWSADFRRKLIHGAFSAQTRTLLG